MKDILRKDYRKMLRYIVSTVRVGAMFAKCHSYMEFGSRARSI